MAAVDFSITSGDTLPVLTSTLLDSDGEPIDLTDALSVGFAMALEGSDELTVTAAAAFSDTPADGTVSYTWEEDDTALPGSYLGVFVVTWPTGTQTYPEDSLRIRVQPNLTAVPAAVAPFCTTADVAAETGQDVDQGDLAIAWSVIEGITGRPLYELTVAPNDVLSPRDLFWIKKAICWQSVWVVANPDFFSTFDVSTTSQSGQSGTFNTDGLILAPMARRCLRWVTWTKTRSVKIQRPFPYARLLNPTVNDDLGRPWSAM